MVSAETKDTKPVMILSPEELGVKLMAPEKEANVAFSTWIRALLQGWRQGTVSCKGRSDVARSGKKPWKQKGTGRARAGTARSPLWRGGGVIFGPQQRIKKFQVSKKSKKAVFKSLLNSFMKQGKILSIDWQIEGDFPKTSKMYDLLKRIELSDKKILIFLQREDLLAYASLRNLPNATLVFFDQANAFDIVKSDYLVFFKKDFDRFKEMVVRWIGVTN